MKKTCKKLKSILLSERSQSEKATCCMIPIIWCFRKGKDYYFANEGPSSQGYGFSSGHVKPSAEELMLLNYGVGEDS